MTQALLLVRNPEIPTEDVSFILMRYLVRAPHVRLQWERTLCKELHDLIRTLHLPDRVFTSIFSICG